MLGKNIRYLRKKREMGQEDLAKLLSRGSYTTVQKWESDSSQPSIKIVKEIADIFNVTIDELVKIDLSAPYNQTNLALNYLEKSCGEDVRTATESYISLDTSDRAEIRGEMKQMLKADKYIEEQAKKEDRRFA